MAGGGAEEGGPGLVKVIEALAAAAACTAGPPELPFTDPCRAR